MASFSVETETLRALARDLSSVQETLHGLKGIVEGYGGQLGSADVEQNLTNFVSTWSQGISSVSDLADGLQQVAAGAANTYEDAEHRIASAAGGSS